MTVFCAEHFAQFYREVHGYPPFEWQKALCAEVLERGWPEAIDIPTGLGKTSAVDVAVYVLAARVAASRRRTFFVVDRRIVVDEAYEHARAIRKALGHPGSEAVRAVADALRPVPAPLPDRSGAAVPVMPLEVERMRGGVEWSSRWSSRPDQPLVVTSTIDQLGSRLLFRGYGCSKHWRPIDAALVGIDSLVIIDEAHLAAPLVETLRAAQAFDQPTDPLSVSPPHVVVMSATVPAGPEPFRLPDLLGDVERRRLGARKSLHLVEVGASRSKASEQTAAAMVHLADAAASPGLVVALVCNTVHRARLAFDELGSRHGEDVLLLTGRVRPVDRDLLLAQWLPLIRTERERRPGAAPLFVVATQTIEVGANVDFDVLISESASLDALTQRLGRLNRTADSPADPPLAFVVHHQTTPDDDPVYGAARNATWAALAEFAPVQSVPRQGLPPLERGLDASPAALAGLRAALGRTVATPLSPPPARTPQLFEWMVDRWSHTSPEPLQDVPVGPFLHGVDRASPSVRLAWRQALDHLGTDEGSLRAVADYLADRPPRPHEMVEVPLPAARAWLQSLVASADDATLAVAAAAIADVPDASREEDAGAGSAVAFRRGADIWEPVEAGRLRPDDDLVVPSSYGGLDLFGWAPASRKPVADVDCLGPGRRRRGPGGRAGAPRFDLLAENARLLLAREGCPVPDALQGSTAELCRRLVDAEDEGAVDQDAAAAVMAAIREAAGASTQLGGALARLEQASAAAYAGDAPDGRWLTWEPSGLVRGGDDGPFDSSTGSQVTLDRHHRAVADRARTFATSLGLPGPLAEAVVLAAGWHDLGKCDPRFQAELHGHALMAEVGSALAKSGMSRRQATQARRRSGYPGDMRHEAFSALAVKGRAAVPAGVDHDLVVHLVASHHGRARPLLPPVVDPAPVRYWVEVDGQLVEVSTGSTVDWDHPARFAALQDRYGRWGLALLETVVRLADICCSEEGS